MKKLRLCLVAADLLLGILILGRLSMTLESRQTMAVPVCQMADLKIKKVALSFDDGPHPKYTKELLDGLAKRNVKATFFVIGERAENYPELVERMHEEGHLIGNHTYNHVQLTTISMSEGEEQIHHSNQVIEEITGEEPEYLRPPYGDCCEELEERLPMFVALWDIDTLDWTGRSVNGICQEVFEHVKDGDIILMHDGYPNSVTAALKIVDTLSRKGYRFVTLEELFIEE
ncbi:MAG: polysaccharide deacetylase family protein [Lachnospiraceae bacterium]